MKILFTILVFCLSSIDLSQSFNNDSENSENNLKITDFNVLVTVDSAEEVESTFKIKDIRDALEMSSDMENMSFKIICNGDTMSNGEKSTLTYEVNGDSKNVNAFLKSVKRIRKAAIKYYKNKQ